MREWKSYRQVADGAEHTVVGDVKVLAGFHSPQLGNERDLLVYLPPSYREGDRRYPVLYMQDGQNLFDRATSFGEEWEVDNTLDAASDAGLEAIVVGVPNAGEKRVDEYSPFHDARLGGGSGQRYLDFLTESVKPVIDSDFRTRPGRETTGIAGSSLGALISLYAFFQRPDVFGFTGIMSPALWFAGRAIFDFVEAAHAPPGRIYLDCGTREGPAEVRDVTRMRDLLRRKAYGRRDLLCVIEKDAGHEERAWARRLRSALGFLLEPSRLGGSSARPAP